MTVAPLHSILRPDALAPVVTAMYGLAEVPRYTVWHRGMNDYYLVRVGGDCFVLRVYPAFRHWTPTDSEIRFELDLLTHLSHANLPVVPPIETASGSFRAS